jgi:hypothetical protein
VSSLQNEVAVNPIIISNMSGGLGNQLFRFFGALNYSIMVEQELQINVSSLVLHNPKYNQTTKRDLELGSYSRFLDSVTISEPHTKLIPKWTKYVELLPPNMSANLGILNDKNFKAKRFVQRKTYATGDFQNIELLPNDEIILDFFDSRDSNSTWLADEIEKAKVRKPIFLHLRLTDYKKFPDIYPIPTLGYYSKGISYLESLLGSKEIWLFSDDKESAIEFFGKISHKFIFPSIPRDARPSDVLELMSHGSGMVMGNSTFSWWAAYLSSLRNSSVKIVMPNRFTSIDNSGVSKLKIPGSYTLPIDS